MNDVLYHKSPRYLIIGNGRVAKHFEHYFTLERLPTQSWSRKEKSEDELRESFESSDITLLLISDNALESFIKERPFLKSKPLVHFSGVLTLDSTIGIHPLMSFPQGRYTLETYRQIPFVCEHDKTNFKKIFPTLQNPNFEIDPQMKPLYHALCSLSGNLTTLLWQKTFQEFTNTLKLPREVLLPYLHQVMHNLASHPEHALTGPLARKDTHTLKKQLSALAGDPYQQIYTAFIKAHLPPNLAQEVLNERS